MTVMTRMIVAAAIFLVTGGVTMVRAQTITVTAHLELIDDVQLPVREGGVVGEVLVKPGDLVKAGQLLLTMDDAYLKIQRDAAALEAQIATIESLNDVDLRYAKKSQAVSMAELQRSRQAVDAYPKSVTKSELDQAKLVTERATLAAEQAARDLDAKQLALQLKNKSVELLNHRISLGQVCSPIAGVVTIVNKDAGEWANTGEPAISIIRLDKLQAKAFVDGQRYDQSLLGVVARLSVKLPPGDTDLSLDGIVSYVAPKISYDGELEIRVEIENPDLVLRPGMEGKLSLDLPAK